MTDDILTYTLRAVQMRLASAGAPPQQTRAVLGEVDAEVRAVYGNARVYIPARGRVRQARDIAICAEYASGHSIPRLAARYELCAKQIKRILSSHPAISRYNAAPSHDQP